MTQLYYPQFPINYPAPSIKSSTEMEEILMQLHLSSMKLDANQKPIVNTQSAVQPSTSPRSPSSEFTRYAGGAFEQSPEPENLPLPSFIKKRPMELSKSADSVSASASFSSESLSASDEELYDTPLTQSNPFSQQQRSSIEARQSSQSLQRVQSCTIQQKSATTLTLTTRVPLTSLLDRHVSYSLTDFYSRSNFTSALKRGSMT